MKTIYVIESKHPETGEWYNSYRYLFMDEAQAKQMKIEKEHLEKPKRELRVAKYVREEE